MDQTRGSEASERARTAGERVEQLQERLGRLRAGEPVTDEDVHQAEVAAMRGSERSAEAHHYAYLANRRAAESHRLTAKALDAGGHSEQAAEHRRLAAEDDVSAEGHSDTPNENGD